MASFEWPDKGSSGGSGDVVGPAISTDNAVALFDGVTGKLLKNSVVIINAGAVSGITSLAMSGALTLSGLTADRAVYLNGSKEMVSSTTSGTELNYVTGVTSAIQTQLNAKISTTLTDGNILVGSALNVATSVAMSGEATIINTGAVTLSNAAVIAKVLTGYVKGAGTVAATDSILQAIQKLDGNADGKISTSLADGNIIVGNGSGVAASVAMSGEATIINTGAVTLSNSAVIAKVLTGYTSGAGTVAATDTILEAVQKLNGNDLLKQPLATLTTKGDLYAATGASTVVRLAAGTNGFLLQANSGATEGLQYVTPQNSSYAIVNLELVASVGSSALTIDIKTSAGTDASATDPIFIGFGDATLANGNFSIVSLAAALGITIPSTATMGQSSGIEADIYVYAINSAGTIKIGVAGIQLDETLLHSSVAIGTGSDSSNVLYSDAIYSNIRIRCIGRARNTQATAGTWATAPSNLSLQPLPVEFVGCAYSSNSGQNIEDTTPEVILFEDKEYDSHNAYDTTTGLWTAPVACKVSAYALLTLAATGQFSGTEIWDVRIYKNGSEIKRFQTSPNSSVAVKPVSIYAEVNLAKGDTIAFWARQNSTITLNLESSTNAFNYMSIHKIG